MRIAVLLKQIPAVEEMALGPDGRILREGLDLEMNAYCRRAVSKGVELASERPGSHVTFITQGPLTAEDALREAIAWASDRGVEAEGVLVSDPAMAGSDTLATARTLSTVLRREGTFDLILTGLNSLDADTGQVPPQIAQLLGLPFAAGVKRLDLLGDALSLTCEHDDETEEREVELPALLSCAERLTEPSKVEPEGREAVPASRIRRVWARDLGEGPFGEAGSPTRVGETRKVEVQREARLMAGAPLAEQVHAALRVLERRGALEHGHHEPDARVPHAGGPGPVVAVIAEPGRPAHQRQLLGVAAKLAADIGGSTVALVPATHRNRDGYGAEAPPAIAAGMPNRRGADGRHGVDAATLGSWGADRVVAFDGVAAAEDTAHAIAGWAKGLATPPWAALAGSTAWGREVAARVAAELGAGLTGDAIELEVEGGRLVAWKPAFGGQLVAAIRTASATQMATVRAGVLPHFLPRDHVAEVETIPAAEAGRMFVTSRIRTDDIDLLPQAHAVVGVGAGVDPADYAALQPLLEALGAELGATRKVTDKGWMPRARQIGITGRSITPRLYVAIGVSGKFNHMVGVRAAGTVLAINPDPNAAIWKHADAGIVGDWREVVPMLAQALAATAAPARP